MFDFKQLAGVLYTAVLSDVMDEFGMMDQAMKPFIRPAGDSLVVMGRASTGLVVETFSVRTGENPFELEIALLDDIRPDDICVLACNGPTTRIAPWGELLTTASMARGGTGCVTDGLVRDLRHIKQLKFPVFHGGIGPLDSKGRARMVEMDRPVECGGVKVKSGDIIFGDIDGVVVLPQEKATAIVARALEKVQSENNTRDELLNGKLLREVYEKYGVL